ncbi:LIC_13387 family protein [Arenimonas oryziterrae]|nr:hypothetical protein [Arenimonas oryziterrae]
MLEQILLVTGAAIFGLLGTLHLLYTFFTNKFDTRNPAVGEAMRATSPVLTGHTTVWKAWIGFNGSHSLGAMMFSAVYLLLAIGHMDWLRVAPVFVWLAVVNCLAYLVLAIKYWFRIPLTGIAISTVCFLIAALRLGV